MKRELGIARCGLACCLCSENDKCSGCNSGECPDKEWCENRKCSVSRNLEHCYNCDENCRKGLLSKIKPYAFTEFAKRYGEDYLLDCLERNEKNGIIYHRNGIFGDYDKFDDVEMLIDFIKTGSRKLDFSVITACGECCTNCKKRIDGICNGCIEADGYVSEWADTGRCKVHTCVRNHNVQFCGVCSEFPCKDITRIIHWNANIVEHMTELKRTYYSFINNCIIDINDIGIKNIALNFVGFLDNNEMTFERAGGYWDKQQYFYVKYKNESVCYILINGKGDEEKFNPFTVWTDDSNSKWYCNDGLSEYVRNTAIKHIDVCEKCGACSGGTEKQIFENMYSNVCRTTFRFVNPNTKEIECLKELILLRKHEIDEGL